MNLESHPCVFRGLYVREQIDPRVEKIWSERFGKPVPFGNLRKQFREAHCAELNPYTSTHCPYREADCGIAFLQCVDRTVRGARTRRTASGYFRAVAKSLALRRADEKPLARDVEIQDQAKAAKGPGISRAVGAGGVQGHASAPAPRQQPVAVRSVFSRPDSIGDVLRAIDTRPRQRPADDGEESAL